MILKASQRGGAKQLALHLLRSDENELVTVHELRGFLTADMVEAFKEVQALSKGTKCKQPFFSVSFNPPEAANVSLDVFEAAIARVEERNDLVGQPRAIVFHEKEGRRHAHVVWSRIDVQSMTARNLPHFKLKLRDISRALYMEHGWRMPRGLINSQARDPRNFKLAEWQQSKRIGISARDIKAMVQECWAASDSRAAFAQAVAERGFALARGDRRDFVLVSCEGEVLGLRSQTGKRTAELKAKLGDANSLPSVAETQRRIARDMKQTFRRHMREAGANSSKRRAHLEARRGAMVNKHQQERTRMEAGIRAREEQEQRTRAQRLRSGFSGLWQFMTGTRSRIVRENAREAYECFERDRAQRDALIVEHLKERRGLQRQIRFERQQFVSMILKLRADRTRLTQFNEQSSQVSDASAEQSEPSQERPSKQRRTRRPRRQNRQPRGQRHDPSPEM